MAQHTKRLAGLGLALVAILAGAQAARAMEDVAHPFLLWTKDEAAAIAKRLETDPAAKVQYERMVEYSKDPKHGHPTLLNLFRYMVLGDEEAGAKEKQELLKFAGRIPEPLTDEFKRIAQGKKWVRGNASFSDRHMRDEQTLNVLRYDVFYDELTPEQRQRIQGSFRAYIEFHLDGHRPWHPDFRYGRMTWLPNMHWPRTIGTHLMAVALKDEAAVKAMFESTGGFKYFFDDYLGDGRFYMEEFGKYYSNIGTMMMYCEGLRRLGLDQYGYGYTGKGGATMRKFLMMHFAIGYPEVTVPGGRDIVSVVSMGDTPSDHFGLPGLGGDVIVAGYLPDGQGGQRKFGASRMNGPLPKLRLPTWFEMGHRRWPDAGFGYFLAKMRKPGDEVYYPSLYFGLEPIGPGDAPAPDVESYVAMERGFAMLRAEESPAYWESPKPAVALQFGMYYVHYAHDCFSLLGYYAKNRPIYVQGWGAKGGTTNESIQSHPRGYIGGHPWHDTVRGHAGGVVVDNLKAMPITGGENGLEHHRIRQGFHPPVTFAAGRVEPTEVTDTRWVFNEEKDEMEVVQEKTTRGIYPDVDLERGLFLTDEYLLDVYWLQSSRPRQYDWHVLGAGSHRLDAKQGWKATSELNGSMLYRDVGAEQPEGHEDKTDGNDLRDVRRADLGAGTWSSVIVQDCNLDDPAKSKLGKAWYDRGVGVRVTMLGTPGTVAYAGRPPSGGKKGPAPLPETGGAVLMVRRHTEDTTFVALHEPFEGGDAKAPKTVLEAVAHEPETGLAVRVRGEGLDDRVLMALGDGIDTPVTLGDGQESFTFTDYGFLRVGRGTVEVWGNVAAMTLKVAGSPKLTVNGKPAQATVAGGTLTYQGE